jgi:hypothetical protein
MSSTWMSRSTLSSVFLAVAADVLHGKLQDILVADGIRDEVFVQSLLEEVEGGAFA